MRILVVDDNPQYLKLTQHRLHELGVSEVLTASNGREGLDLAKSSDGEDLVDLVLCDWNMPEMDGMEFFEHVRSQSSDIQFILVTGFAEPSSIARAKAEGVTLFCQSITF